MWHRGCALCALLASHIYWPESGRYGLHHWPNRETMRNQDKEGVGKVQGASLARLLLHLLLVPRHGVYKWVLQTEKNEADQNLVYLLPFGILVQRSRVVERVAVPRD